MSMLSLEDLFDVSDYKKGKKGEKGKAAPKDGGKGKKKKENGGKDKKGVRYPLPVRVRAGHVRCDLLKGLAGDHALMVAVVIQERQDAERPVVQRDNGISEAKVRTPA